MNNMLNKIFEKIKNKEPFSLIRYGDGEKNILNNIACERKGFSYNPMNIDDCIFRSDLKDALEYDGGKNYFIGINDKKLEKDIKGTIISPMIFVNENYLEFLKQLKNIALEIPVILIVNKVSRLTKIPFPFSGFFSLEDNAWQQRIKVEEQISEWIKDVSSPVLILVAGGAYSCSLIHKIWEKNRQHILIDIGSTLDPYLFGKNTRKYQDRLNNDS